MKAQTLRETRWVGRVLRDKWRIDARIARGGMGTVFAATHRNNGSTAAIKILHPEFSRDEDTRSRFLQEGYAANQVNHPGVVRILDDDMSEEGLAYLVMELLEGELLEQRRLRKGGRLPLTEVYEFADQLLDVLATAHAKDIVHRDIKPDNIFITKQGRLKVLDFGFAQMKSGFRKEQTATGFLLGTPGFMAPEQAVGNRPRIDAQTDIWAVGATMFLLLTGEPVHQGDSAAEMLIAAANFPARPIGGLVPGLPAKLQSAVDRALAFDKGARWPDARAMQAALRSVRSSDPVLHERPAWRNSIPEERMPSRSDEVEELADGELQDHISATMPASYPHQADRDGPTVAVTRDVAHRVVHRTNPGRSAPFPNEIPNLSTESVAGDETVVMESRPLQHAPGNFIPTPRPSFPEAYPTPRGRPSFPGFPQGEPGLHGPPLSSSSPMFGSPMSSMAPDSYPQHWTPAGPVAAPNVGNPWRVLILVALAVVTMVVVILTGLLVIVGSD